MTTTEEPTTTTIPTKMKKLVVAQGGPTVEDCKLEVQEVDVPTVGSNDVLVKMVAAAVNPSDYGSWTNAKPNASMGKEGSGIVVALGGGIMTKRFHVGQKVGVVGLPESQGTYSEYVTMDATKGPFPMPDDLPVEDAASFFVNPYTVIGIMDTAKNAGSKALVHTAAASQLGQMMVKLSQLPELSNGVEIINVVRRKEQVEILETLGAKHIVNSSDENWKETLKQKIKELECTVAFDAVGGSSTGDLLSIMPPKGIVHVYGGLGGPCKDISVVDLIYQEKQVKGFFLTAWLQKGGTLFMIPRMIMASKKVNAGLSQGGWSAAQFKDVTVKNMQDELVKNLEGSATGIKLRVRFDQEG